MPEQRSALQAVATTPAGDGNDPSLRELPVAGAMLILGWDGTCGGDVSTAAAVLGLGEHDGHARGDGVSLLAPLAPGRWLAATTTPAAATALRRELTPAHRIDLDSAHTWLRLSGPEADSALARELPIDLREQAFPKGRSAQSVVAQVDVLVHALQRGPEPAFDLLVSRSYAVHLVTHLTAAGDIAFAGHACRESGPVR